MSNSIQHSLEKLRNIAPEMNRVADSSAQIVQAVESTLTNLNIGIEAAKVFRTTHKSETVSEHTTLAYRRVKGAFRIAVVVERQTEVENDNFSGVCSEILSEVPWAECPRDVKLNSFPTLPGLLEKIVMESEDAKQKVEKAQKAVDMNPLAKQNFVQGKKAVLEYLERSALQRTQGREGIYGLVTHENGDIYYAFLSGFGFGPLSQTIDCRGGPIAQAEIVKGVMVGATPKQQ